MQLHVLQVLSRRLAFGTCRRRNELDEHRPAASWGGELRNGLVSCSLTVGTVSRCCFHNELCSVAETVHGDDFFVVGPRQDFAKMGATLKKRWETRDQMIGPKPDDPKELRNLNRSLRGCKDGTVFAANLRHGREVVNELGLSKSKPAPSPATRDGATRARVTNSNRSIRKGFVCISGLWQSSII